MRQSSNVEPTWFLPQYCQRSVSICGSKIPMPYYDWAMRNSMVRIHFRKGLHWNQASKSISSRIEYSLVWNGLSGHGFDAVGGDENVDLFFDSILKKELDRILALFEIGETVRQMYMTKVGNMVEESFLKLLTMEWKRTTYASMINLSGFSMEKRTNLLCKSHGN